MKIIPRINLNLSYLSPAIYSKYIIALFLFALAISCTNKSKVTDDKQIIISGQIKNSENQKLSLQLLRYNEKITIDSTFSDKEGNFLFSYLPDEKSIFLLKKDDNHYITIIADQGENIEITADYENFEKNYSIKGSDDSQLLCQLNNHLQINQRKLDSIAAIWETAIKLPNRTEIKQTLDSAYFNALKDQYLFQKQFIETNSSSLAALIALYLPLGREAVLRESADFAVFENLSNELLKKLPNNSHSINFAKRIKQKKMLEQEKNLSEKAANNK
jgi:hypothetical protein